MMKRILILLSVCLLVFSVQGSVVPRYIIGAYSQYQLHNAHQTEEVFSELAQLLDEAGFNTILYSTYYQEVVNGRLEAALKALNNYEMGSIIDDWAFDPNRPVGVTAMANGNYLKMEAEYHWSPQVERYNPEAFQGDNAENDLYNMVFRHDTGRRSSADQTSYSNSFAWVCDAKQGDKAGMALSDPRFRWKPDNIQYPRLLSYDLKFFPTAKDNRLYLKFALNWQDLPANARVAEVKLYVLRNTQFKSNQDGLHGLYPSSAYQQLPLYSTQPELYDTLILNQNVAQIPKDPDTGALILEYYTPIPQPGTKEHADLINVDYFSHLSPHVYWFGQGRLELDYVELEDNIFRALKAAHDPLKDRLEDRLKEYTAIPGSNSILYFYGKDEPSQGQFATYKLLKGFLEDRGYGIITATHLENMSYKKGSQLPDYFHFGLFLQEANPSVVMLDAYPLQEWGSGAGTLIRWNQDFDHVLFVQNKIQNYVCNNYHVLASSVKGPDALNKNTDLFYVPQTFGEKFEPVESAEWRYFMPPLSMQKCLQLLPLCYAADGIIDFALTSNRDQSFPSGERSFRRLTPISHKGNYLQPQIHDNESFYQNLMEANAKIKVYGPIISRLHWQDANTLMIDGKNSRSKLAQYKLKSLGVVKKKNGPYEGYLECGYYLDDEDVPSLMVVNRRAVYRTEGEGSAPWNVEEHFQDADPQTLRVALDKSTFGDKNYGLYDPFMKHTIISDNDVYDIEIAAGDGILLQLVEVVKMQTPQPAQKRNWFKRLFGIK